MVLKVYWSIVAYFLAALLATTWGARRSCTDAFGIKLDDRRDLNPAPSLAFAETPSNRDR